MTGSVLHQKIRGMLIASSVGSILGRQAENLPYLQVVERFGVLTDPFHEVEQNRVGGMLGTDENALMLLACEAFVEKGGRITIEDLANTWKQMVNPLDFGDGGQRTKVNYLWYILRNTYELLRMGCPARVVGAFNVPANTGLSVVGPVAAFNACNADQAYLDCLGLAALFQRDRGIHVPAILAAAVAEALRPSATAESVTDVALRLAPSQPHITARTRRVTSLREALLEAVHVASRHSDPLSLRADAYQHLIVEGVQGDPQEMLALTFAVFVSAKGATEEALIGGANMGRDSDTLAAMVGLLCGALNGVDSVPARWVAGFHGLVGAETLVKAANRLADMAVAHADRSRTAASQVLHLTKA